MGIALTIINLICFWGAWYFLGRCSIYAKLIKEYREALRVASVQEAIIQAYKNDTEETEKNGKQN